MRENTQQKNEKVFTIKYIVALCLCAMLTFLISKYVVGLAVVVGDSMQPTMDSGDITVVNKLPKNYDRFDIVIVDSGSSKIIKRIVGCPGDTIHIRDGFVYINDKVLEDVVYAKTEFAGIAYEPIKLRDGEYFVLGDNRPNSKDSRFDEIGIVNKSQIDGRVIFSLLPLATVQ